MNALTTDERAACRKASEYYAALADGKEIEWFHVQSKDWTGYRPLNVHPEDFKLGCNFRILSPPKMRAFRDEELPELLGVKISRYNGKSPRMICDTAEESPSELLSLCTYYDGPHKGLPVGKVCDA